LATNLLQNVNITPIEIEVLEKILINVNELWIGTAYLLLNLAAKQLAALVAIEGLNHIIGYRWVFFRLNNI